MSDAYERARRSGQYLALKLRLLRSANHARGMYEKVQVQPYAHRLTSSDKRTASEYAHAVFGSSVFQAWLKLYFAIHGTFREGWIPDNFFGLVALPIVNGQYRTISDAKSLSRRVLATDRIPDLAYFVNGVWMDTAGNSIPRHEVKDLLASTSPTVVVKLENSSQGRSVFCVRASDLVLSELESHGRLVVQSYISQHELLASLSPGCLATLRITTGWTQSGVRVLGSYLRMGHAGAKVIKSAEALKAVVAADGRLDQFAYAPHYARHVAHPDTGVRFAGIVVPSYASAASLVISLHGRVPQFMIIGWDIGIGADGEVQIIEWNTDHPDIKFAEAVGGPHLTPLRLEAHAKQIR